MVFGRLAKTREFASANNARAFGFTPSERQMRAEDRPASVLPPEQPSLAEREYLSGVTEK